MGKKVFISYNHKQRDWVRDRLKPCIEAGGAEVLIDLERFQAGRNLGRPDGQAAGFGRYQPVGDDTGIPEKRLLPKHEMERAIDRDPSFSEGRTIPNCPVTVARFRAGSIRRIPAGGFTR
jgi:hypothetical protein